MTDTSNTLHVIINDKIVLEYDRNKPIPVIQLEYLDNIDARLDASIQITKKASTVSRKLEKAQFVANSMVNSLLNNNDNLAIAMCTYLGNRIPDLKQIVCIGKEEDKGIKIEFIYDRNLQQTQQEQTIKFFDPKDFQKHK